MYTGIFKEPNKMNDASEAGLWQHGKFYVVFMLLLIKSEYLSYAILLAGMLKSLFSKRQANDTFRLTCDTLTNSEMSRIFSMHSVIFRYRSTVPRLHANVSNKTN